MATITTKFNKGDKVIYINEYGKIRRRPIQRILVSGSIISYEILAKKAATSLDKDTIHTIDEEFCFATVTDLSEFAKSELDKP